MRLREKFHNIPLWLINAISVISGIVPIIVSIATAISTIMGRVRPQELAIAAAAVLLVLLNIVQFMQIKNTAALPTTEWRKHRISNKF